MFDVLDPYKKIYILGLAGSGKTYLANKLGKSTDTVFCTDWLMYDKSTISKRIKLTKEEYMTRINSVVINPNWIIEGVHFFHEIAESADLIIFIDPPLYKNIIRLINRYISDSNYRKTYTTLEHFNLIKKSFKYYYSSVNMDLINYPKYKVRNKYLHLLNEYKHKTLRVKSNKEILNTKNLPNLVSFQ